VNYFNTCVTLAETSDLWIEGCLTTLYQLQLAISVELLEMMITLGELKGLGNGWPWHILGHHIFIRL
jgi:hypothetical protein